MDNLDRIATETRSSSYAQLGIQPGKSLAVKPGPKPAEVWRWALELVRICQESVALLDRLRLHELSTLCQNDGSQFLFHRLLLVLLSVVRL